MKKLLIVYYSWATGNTERVAKTLQRIAGGELLKIDTAVPYSGSYNDVVEQGQHEVERGFEPELKPLGADVSAYDVVAVGTPTWWYTMLWYMKHCNYEKFKPTLIKAGMSHLRDESPEEVAYAQNMFETIFKDFKQEKDVHISSLLAGLMNQTPVTADDFAVLEGKILLILPNQDFFSGKMQQDLIKLMHEPKISYVSGGHLSTVLKADDYIRTIREFLGK